MYFIQDYKTFNIRRCEFFPILCKVARSEVAEAAHSSLFFFLPSFIIKAEIFTDVERYPVAPRSSSENSVILTSVEKSPVLTIYGHFYKLSVSPSITDYLWSCATKKQRS